MLTKYRSMQVTWLALLHTAKRLPDLFCSELVRDALCSLLR